MNLKKLLALLLVTLVSYGQTIFMYFWQDDSALIFKLQHQAEIAGSFGAGLFDRGPYRYLVVPFVPFFPLFKLNPLGYFIVGFVSYFILVIAMHWLLAVLFKEKKIAFFGAIIFASGYVGSDTMFRVINSWQTNIGILFSIFTIGNYFIFTKHKISKNYFYSIAFYLLSIELVFIRSHSLIASIVAIEFFTFITQKLSIRSFVKSLMRLLPFLALFNLWYLTDASFGAPGIKMLLQRIFSGEWSILMPYLASVGNIFVPDIVQSKIITTFRLNTLWVTAAIVPTLIFQFTLFKKYIKAKAVVLLLAVEVFIIFLCYLSFTENKFYFKELSNLLSSFIAIIIIYSSLIFFFSEKLKNNSLAAFFGLLTLLAQFGSYYIQYPESVFWTSHRYMSYAFVGFVIVFSYFLTKINSDKYKYLTSLFVIIMFSILSVKYQYSLLVNRSFPAKKFYSDLKKQKPSMAKGSVLYFDVEKSPYIQTQFGDFFGVGSMPDTTAIAIYYNVDRYDFQMTNDFDEFISILDENKIAPDSLLVNTFKYSPKGLVNTTDTTRKLLTKAEELDGLSGEYSGVYHKLSFNISLSTTVQDNADYSFPQYKSWLEMKKYNRDYYSKVKVQGGSEWRGREIGKIIDQDENSAWQGHRISWANSSREFIKVVLPEARVINKIVWTNWIKSLSPMAYLIEISTDDRNWQLVKNIDEPGKKDNEKTEINFDPVNAKYVRITFSKTLTNDSPAIAEIYIPSIDFTSVDLDYKKKVFVDPNKLSYLKNSLRDGFPLQAIIKKSDNTVLYKEFWVKDLSNPKFSEILPPGAVPIDIKVITQLPFDVSVSNIKVQNVTFEEMKKNNLIKKFSVN